VKFTITNPMKIKTIAHNIPQTIHLIKALIWILFVILPPFHCYITFALQYKRLFTLLYSYCYETKIRTSITSYIKYIVILQNDVSMEKIL
jgi:hypothetical protein